MAVNSARFPAWVTKGAVLHEVLDQPFEPVRINRVMVLSVGPKRAVVGVYDRYGTMTVLRRTWTVRDRSDMQHWPAESEVPYLVKPGRRPQSAVLLLPASHPLLAEVEKRVTSG